MATASSRAQSETIGFVLVFALVIAGAGLTVAIGGSGILDTQSSMEFQRAENSMTLFDSRAAMVALGDSGGQTVSLGQDGGQVSIEEDAGWLRVTHQNYTNDNGTTEHREVIYNETLGQVVYEGDSGTLAYQGGGVWQIYGSGNAQMVSPPEFHYRGATLTLPAIQVFGSGSASGSVDMNIRPQQQARLVYPNQTTHDENGVGAPYDEATSSTDPTNYYGFRNYTNPVRNGTVNVTVKSEYADGWETYFRQRTTGDVSRDGDKVTLRLETISGPPGEFDMPELNSDVYVDASGIGENHPITQFETTLVWDKGGGTREFSYWYEDEETGEQWELHVSSEKSGGIDCSSPPDVYIAQYYYNGSDQEEYEYWVTTIEPSSDAISWDCVPTAEAKSTIDFANTDSDTEMAYDNSGFSSGGGGNGKLGGGDDPCDGNQWCFAPDIKDMTMKSDVTLDGHGSVDSCEVGTYSKGESNTDCMLGHIVNHYLSEAGPNVQLHARGGPGGSTPVDGEESQGTLLYEESANARFVTYLHITQNEIEVSLDA
jgi:hypothetical protein